MANIWSELQKPIFALAPMEDVTDSVFRRVIVNCGRPSIMFTEFTNCEGLQSVGQARVIHRLYYTPIEKPLIAQIWGITPENYYQSAKLVVSLGFDGLDLNFGCPVKNVIKLGACSALINNRPLAKEIIQATLEGLNGQIPLSIKTRIGFNRIQTEDWIGFLLSTAKPACLTVHGRTVKEQSKYPVHWEEIAKCVSLRDQLSPKTLILGNGDIKTYPEALEKIATFKLDGVMIGRAVFSNPWFFNPKVDPTKKTKLERLNLLKFHLELFAETWGQQKDYHILKRFFKIYLQGFEQAAHLRQLFMETKNYAEAQQLVEQTLREWKLIANV